MTGLTGRIATFANPIAGGVATHAVDAVVAGAFMGFTTRLPFDEQTDATDVPRLTGADARAAGRADPAARAAIGLATARDAGDVRQANAGRARAARRAAGCAGGPVKDARIALVRGSVSPCAAAVRGRDPSTDPVQRMPAQPGPARQREQGAGESSDNQGHGPCSRHDRILQAAAPASPPDCGGCAENPLPVGCGGDVFLGPP